MMKRGIGGPDNDNNNNNNNNTTLCANMKQSESHLHRSQSLVSHGLTFCLKAKSPHQREMEDTRRQQRSTSYTRKYDESSGVEGNEEVVFPVIFVWKAHNHAMWRSSALLFLGFVSLTFSHSM